MAPRTSNVCIRWCLWLWAPRPADSAVLSPSLTASTIPSGSSWREADALDAASHHSSSRHAPRASRPTRIIPQKEFERRVDPNDKNAQNLLDEMRQHVKKLEDMRKNEDPRLSFSTPEFKEAQRTFTDGFKKNFGKPVEWGLVKDYAWSTPQLRKLVRC